MPKINSTQTPSNAPAAGSSPLVLENLCLLIKEFELAYNLGPTLPQFAKKKLKREFIALLKTLGLKPHKLGKFSFDLGKMLELSKQFS